MRVLVTGGAGFIGSAIIQKLQEKADEVFVIDNLSFGNRSFISIPDDRFYKLDIRNEAEVVEALDEIQPEIVLHLAAIHFIPYCNKHPFEASDINIRGTMNLLKAIKACGSVKQFFFASTAAVYPILDGPIPETAEKKPLDIYGLTKLVGEELSEKFHLETGIPTIICRFFNAFGPNETNPHLIPEIQQQVNNGKRIIQLGNLDPKRDFIHTSDMANAIDALLQHVNMGFEIFNLGRGIEYSVVEVVKAFEAHLDEAIEIEVDPERVRKVERMHLLSDISKITSFTGWKPVVSLEEGIETLIRG
ncbi:NAD-dependent epimerase/dehydratase family protein [Flavihumibacter cheonanensis]|uniref:NAD-dependent epimerase/dehydratase family protein n=1 Tax=Flavihumibacter cheonanensis TaxID=1442385 RepID=UPI001EF9B1D2|nr:NAD(P)-dependent oxidoreductase [Flavihumibacter cheonanensis]MCG7753909.1 NAD(P)-dependent oxidoreductase [Flavihumibacter cheonanensis]